MNTSTKIRWSKRVEPQKIRRLYESDAQGILDEELLDDVGYGFYVRCRDLLEVGEAIEEGRVKCRDCGNIIPRQGNEDLWRTNKTELLMCDQCSWQITWEDYYKSIQGKNLHGCGLLLLFSSFLRQWPSARSPQTKMLLIDGLIHEFHVHSKKVARSEALGRPVGVNVIRASTSQVYELLDSLAYGTGSTPGLQETRRQWHIDRKHDEYSKVELRTIARELGIKGCSQMSKGDLLKAVERVDPKRFKAWEWENAVEGVDRDSE